jgi:hypothetical protein
VTQNPAAVEHHSPPKSDDVFPRLVITGSKGRTTENLSSIRERLKQWSKENVAKNATNTQLEGTDYTGSSPPHINLPAPNTIGLDQESQESKDEESPDNDPYPEGGGLDEYNVASFQLKPGDMMQLWV